MYDCWREGGASLEEEPLRCGSSPVGRVVVDRSGPSSSGNTLTVPCSGSQSDAQSRLFAQRKSGLVRYRLEIDMAVPVQGVHD